MAVIQFTPTVSGAYISEIVPFYTDDDTTLNLLVLWNVGNGSSNAPLQILQYNSSANSFFDDTSNIFSGPVPSLGNPRNAVVTDFNGDGPSILIAEQGLDQSPWPGATDTLLLSTPSGQLTDASANLPQTLAYTHDLSSGVINNSGSIGVFVNNIYSQPGTAPYLLISNGDGTFTNKSATFLPASLQNTYPAYTSSALVDLNGDGLADLVLGTEDLTQGPSLIYLNPGNGNFSGVTPIDLPASPLPPEAGLYSSTPTGPTVLDIEPIHISSPNYDDLVTVSTTGDYEGYAIQILINDGTGHFTDQTASRLIGVPLDVLYPAQTQINWIMRPVIVDMNGDGAPDIVTESAYGSTPSQVFLNNGSGDFYLAFSETSSPVMAVATIAGVPTLIESNGTLVPFLSPPVVSNPIPTQSWLPGTTISFTLPSNTFTDPRGQQLSYTASEPADAALPAWLSFNAVTRTFSGTVPIGASPFTVMVTATDTSGWMTEDNINVLVSPVSATVQTAGGIDLTWATLYDELANSPIATGGTAVQYTAVDNGQFNGHTAAIKFVITGTGLTYSGSSPNIQLTGGTITGIQEENTSGNVPAAFSSLSIAATTLQTALNSFTNAGAANPTALNAIFMAPDYNIAGGAGSDKLQGGNLNDTITGSTGNDTINAGAGTNTVDYSSLTTPGLVAIIQGGGGVVNKGGANGNDSLTSVQNLIGSTGGDVFYVDSNETVTGGGGFDYLIELSPGVNLAYGTNLTGIAEFVSNTGANTLNFSTDTNFAYLYGSTGNDTMTLGTGGGYLFGEGGTNVLDGGANATNLFEGGSGGSDTMNGGTGTASNFYFVDGNDQINGAGAFNTMVELVSGVTVQLGSAQDQHVQEFVTDGGANVVSVAGADSDFVYLYGGTGNDTLSTGSGGGYLFGESGTNALNGGGSLNVFVAAGVDTMNGGSASNVYFIDGNSTVHGAGTFNTVIELQQSVSLALGSAQLGTDVQEVVLNTGTNTADFHAATSAVFLYGSSGNDTLFGGTGNDFLYGGAGTNTFAFGTGWGKDTIMDWTTGTGNQIDLTALAGLGVHAVTDLTQTITGGNDVITSSHTGTNSITLMGVGTALTAASFHFA